MTLPNHVCIVVARYSTTGVPLAQLRFAGALARRGFRVDMIMGHVPTGVEMESPPNVNLIKWNKVRAIHMVPDLVRYLVSAKPDVVFAAEDNLNATVLLSAILARSTAKISCSSRISPINVYSDAPFTKGWYLKQFMRSVMWRADALTCVARDMIPQYKMIFPKSRHVGIYNIVSDTAARGRIAEEVSHPWFDDRTFPVCISAGFLAPRKGYDDLIRAVHILSMRRPVRLILLGDGPQRAELQALAEELGIAERVRFEGHVTNPLKYFARSDVFVLSSVKEGMPNVLIEAMMAGCTPVSTDCPTGPREILEGGQYGYLVTMRDPASLAAGIERGLEAPIPADVLAMAVEPFAEEAVIGHHFRELGFC